MLRKRNNSNNVTVQKINLTCPGKIKIDNLTENRSINYARFIQSLPLGTVNT